MKILIKCIKIFITGILSIIVLILIVLAVNRTLASKWMLEACKKELSAPNPISYVFDYPLSHIREAIIKKFNKKPFRQLDLYGNGLGYRDTTHLLVSDIFRQPYTENDFVLAADFVLQSFTYRTGKRGRYCNMRLQIHLDSISPSETRIEIINHDRQMISGYKLGINHMSLIVPIFQTFEPTTIEEYQVLYNIGKYLGVDMPKVIYPENLTEQQILETFNNGVQHLIEAKNKNFLIGNEK